MRTLTMVFIALAVAGNGAAQRRARVGPTVSSISIEDGAFFKGGIDIRKGGQPTQQKANGEEKSVGTPEPAAVGARA